MTLLPAELAGLPHEASHPGNIQASLAIPYTFPNIRATAHWLAETPFRPSWIRTPGRMQNTFGNESFVDEIAVATGVDPFEFRLKNLKDPRGAELLQALAQLANWKPQTVTCGRLTGDVARGRGLAYVKYELVRTYVGAVADVEVNLKTGKVTVTKFYVAHDCGQIINPDGLRNQIEGNVVQTVSRTLIEELTFDRSRVTSLDWVSYPILKFPDVPDVAIKLIDRPNRKAVGRRRADGGHRARRDRQRDLQRDRRAAALGALHARRRCRPRSSRSDRGLLRRAVLEQVQVRASALPVGLHRVMRSRR